MRCVFFDQRHFKISLSPDLLGIKAVAKFRATGKKLKVQIKEFI
jgi:hypothetical protein